MKLREYRTSDCEKMAKLFYDTVHSVNAADYTAEQLNAWATGKVDLKSWDRSFQEHVTVVAIEEENGTEKVVGFGDMDGSGYLDRLYVHRDYQRQGIATAICDKLEHSVKKGAYTTHASITAKPFFLKRGYQVVREQQVERCGILLTNFVMEKKVVYSIESRRSIRKYKHDQVPRELIEKVIVAGIKAPSPKNRQPWRFIVVQGGKKEEVQKIIEKGIGREKTTPLLPDSAKLVKGAEYTLSIIKQVPVLIFIVNSKGKRIDVPITPEERVYEICNAQSIGAVIENMCLTAVELGLGSLWICDTYFAYWELKEWLNVEGELYAALTVGYADEDPVARPRKKMDDIVEWRD